VDENGNETAFETADGSADHHEDYRNLDTEDEASALDNNEDDERSDQDTDHEMEAVRTPPIPQDLTLLWSQF
jgi:hypothetical protein